MSSSGNDGRSPMAVAMYWVHVVTTVGVMMALPPLAGYWLDRRWQTDPWLVAVGATLGFGLGMYHLLRMTRAFNKQPPHTKGDPRS